MREVNLFKEFIDKHCKSAAEYDANLEKEGILGGSDVWTFGEWKDEYKEHYLIAEIIDKIYQEGRADAIEEFRKYLKTLYILGMPKDMWDIGVDNTCDRMLRGEKDE